MIVCVGLRLYAVKMVWNLISIGARPGVGIFTCLFWHSWAVNTLN